MKDMISVKGARQHNLKNVDLDIPKNKLVVFTGVSGSGKSSLAYDTIYAEGQRRYVESLSTYARQFLGIMEKPDVDSIEGLSPAISIDQKTTSKNPRSTVGTITEIYDFMRLLYARIGHPHCPICSREIQQQSIDQMVNSIISLMNQMIDSSSVARFFILSPVVRDKKGEFVSLFENIRAKGYQTIRIDNTIKNINEDFVLIKTNKHSIDVVVDKLSFTKKDIKDASSLSNIKSRLAQSIEQALNLSEGLVIISRVLDSSFEFPENPKKMEDHLFSEKFSCPYDNIQIPEIEPRSFSFNSPHGACPNCLGLGKIQKINKDLIFSESLSIMEGGILPFKNMFENDTWYSRLLLQVFKEKNINPKIPIKNLSNKQKEILTYGTGDEDYKVEGTNRFGKNTYIYQTFSGVVNELERRHKVTDSEWVRLEIEKYMLEIKCPVCDGTRLKKESLGITINDKSISEITSYQIQKLLTWFEEIYSSDLLNDREKSISENIIKEIKIRLNFLISVGLEYLTLDRSSATLSGGEAQRIRLASQIGSGLTGVLYILDEPTIGLHQKDNDRLISTLKSLRDLGNTVIVVEHDTDMMKNSDYIVDFGPGAGKFGGEIIAQGILEEIKNNPNSITGKYLKGISKIDIIPSANKLFIKELSITGVQQNNLKNISTKIPLGKFVVITGVSGSGKSSLLIETLYPAIKKKLNPYTREIQGKYEKIEGLDEILRIILIDQSPIGRTPRSNPATYTKVFDQIREVFSQTRDAKSFGFNKSRFSFNLKGGRCDACEGQGQTKIEMQFMSDIWITCEVCKGKRYNSQTLEVDYKGKNISQVLDMTVDDAVEFFHAHPAILSKLDTLSSVGLGYIQLGQPATTLSGGEAQRVKLSTELSKKESGHSIYILDEPTTGLHSEDIKKLLMVLKLLVNKGNTVLVIEHNLDVIKNADWVIDLGPDGGDKGGYIVAEGGIDKIIENKSSYTGQYLKKYLGL